MMRHNFLLLTLLFINSAAQASNLNPIALEPRASSKISLSQEFKGNLYDFLFYLATEYKMPIGVERNKLTRRESCGIAIQLHKGDYDLGTLIQYLNQLVEVQAVSISDGTLRLVPRKESIREKRFLNLVIPEFHSNDQNHALTGITLWFFYRSVLAPGEATGYGGGGSLSVDKFSIASQKAVTLEGNLDRISRSGGGGVWVLESPDDRTPAEAEVIPFFIYSDLYDSAALQNSLKCTRDDGVR